MVQVAKYANAPLLACCALGLSACGSGDVDVKNGSPEQVAKATADAGIKMSPGLWQTSVKITEFDIPGLPKQAQDMMRAQMAKGQSFEHCVTPEKAEKPDAEIFAGKGKGACQYDNFAMSGGKVEGVMRCSAKDMGESKMTMSGTYAPTEMTMKIVNVISGLGPAKQITMRAENHSKRIGDCK